MSSLSNADFRKIFQSSTGPSGPSDQGSADRSGAKRKEKDFASPKPKKFKAPNPKKKQEEEEKKLEESYRDRAKERRVGQNNDYTISEDAVKGLTVQESKYLGGDMEHTHLVKGLDYALLAKIRSEIEVQQEEELDASLDAQPKGKKGDPNSQAPAAPVLEIKTPLGHHMKRLCLTEPEKKRKKTDLFLPGKTTFVFDLDDDFGADIPTTVSRSIDDLNKYQFHNKRTASMSKSIMASITTIMGYIRQGSRPQKKMVRKERKEEKAAAPKPAVVPDEDIFDDAGTYDLNMRAGTEKDK